VLELRSDTPPTCNIAAGRDAPQTAFLRTFGQNQVCGRAEAMRSATAATEWHVFGHRKRCSLQYDPSSLQTCF
jgi:hypothetical protein